VLAGALPVFAEVDESFTIDPSDIERRITPRTKAIVAVHLQGTPCDMESILAIAKKHDLRVIEDCAQCAGGVYKGKHVGTMGDIGINSFQASKTITSGEGGAVLTNDDTLFERALRYHDVGHVSGGGCPYEKELHGGHLPSFASTNFRMNEFTGAVLVGQLQKLPIICEKLRDHAGKVRAGIADLPGIKLRKSYDVEGDVGSVVSIDWGSFDKCNHFLRAMKAERVNASKPHGSAILPKDERIVKKSTIHPDWPSFTIGRGKELQYGPENFPKTIDIIQRHGGVDMDPKHSEDDVQDIIHAIRKVYLAMAAK